MQCFAFTVSGRVQGVGFRYFARNLAEELGVVGEVWNENDGTVKGIVEGENAAGFVARLHSGPGLVTNVKNEPSPERGFENFDIGDSR